jgi:hypothetical protein
MRAVALHVKRKSGEGLRLRLGFELGLWLGSRLELGLGVRVRVDDANLSCSEPAFLGTPIPA